MIKPLVLTSLYTLAGIAGWGAYNLISHQDTSLHTIYKIASQADQKLLRKISRNSRQLYRYKDQNNHWVYSSKPQNITVIDKYEKEIQSLQKLSPESMPTKDFFAKSQPQNNSAQIAAQKKTTAL